MVAPSPQEWLAAKRLAAESAPKEAPSPQEWLAAKRLAAESKAPVSEWEDNTPVEGVKAYEPSTLNNVGKQFLENLYSGYNAYAGVRQGLVDPAVGVANLIAPKDKKLSNLVTGKEDKWEIPSLPLVNEKSGSYQLARVGGQVAPVNVAMKGAGAVAKVLGASPELVAGITTQGIEGNKAVTGLGSLAANILKTGTLGAGGGVISQAVIDPNSTKNEYLQSGAIGAGTTLGFNTLGAATRAVADLFSGGLSKSNARAILEKVMGDKLAASKAELAPYATPAIEREAKWTAQAPTGVLNPVVGKFNDLNAQIPQTGALTTNLTTGQLLHGISDPKVASLEEMARITNGQPFVNKDLAQRQEWVNANKNVSPNLENAVAQEAHFNAAREARLNALQGGKEQNLANRLNQFETGTAKETPQFGLGENIAERRNQLLRQAKRPFTDNTAPENLGPPLIGEYSKLFTKYPEKFSLQSVYKNANGIVSDLKNQLDPSLVKPVITKATKLFGGLESNLIHGTQPKQGTLAEMHDLLSTIKSTKRDVGTDLAATKNLTNLQLSVEDAINKGLSKDALKEYNALSSEYRTKVAEPFYEGTNLDIARNKRTNQAPLIAPENVTSKYLTESGAKEFNMAFGNDPKAINSLSLGIEQQLMNSSNPEKFLQDNKFALATLDNVAPNLQVRLTDLAGKIRAHGAEKTALEAERKTIPERVAAESATSASAANQARLLKEGINTALPNVNVGDLNKIDPEAYLNFMRKEGGNIENQL